jgi:hypothetical protein
LPEIGKNSLDSSLDRIPNQVFTFFLLPFPRPSLAAGAATLGQDAARVLAKARGALFRVAATPTDKETQLRFYV